MIAFWFWGHSTRPSSPKVIKDEAAPKLPWGWTNQKQQQPTAATANIINQKKAHFVPYRNEHEWFMSKLASKPSFGGRFTLCSRRLVKECGPHKARGPPREPHASSRSLLAARKSCRYQRWRVPGDRISLKDRPVAPAAEGVCDSNLIITVTVGFTPPWAVAVSLVVRGKRGKTNGFSPENVYRVDPKSPSPALRRRNEWNLDFYLEFLSLPRKSNPCCSVAEMDSKSNRLRRSSVRSPMFSNALSPSCGAIKSIT